MFNIIWEFIINLLESFLFAVICNAKFTKRQYHYGQHVIHPQTPECMMERSCT